MIALDPLIGATIGNYRLVARLGSGGMGDVYRGEHPVIGAQVAIKVLQTSSTDREAAYRFALEARVGNHIEHPAVIKVLDAGQLPDGRPYLVMPLIEGTSLADRLRDELRLPVAEACRIAIELLDALAAAHARGVIHRDLKPPNVFLRRGGDVVVLDFGIAKLIGDARLTLTGAALGTPHYMAPEQIKQQAIGPETDVYGVGVVLYEMLCGRVPFDGTSTFDVMAGHLERRPPPPRALRPEIPSAVSDILLQALAKPLARRFATAAAMRDALRAAARTSALDVSRPHATPLPAPPLPVSEVPTVLSSPAPAAPPRRSLARATPWLALGMVAIVATVIALVARGGAHDDVAAPAPAGSGSAVATAPAGPPPPPPPAATVDAAPADPPPPDAAPPDARKRGRRTDESVRTEPRATEHVTTNDPPQRIPLPDEPVHVVFPNQSEDGVGTLELKTEPPGATVRVDGVRRGKTPWSGPLTAGDHAVELSLAGHKTDKHTFQVVANKTVVITIGMAED